MTVIHNEINKIKHLSKIGQNVVTQMQVKERGERNLK